MFGIVRLPVLLSLYFDVLVFLEKERLSFPNHAFREGAATTSTWQYVFYCFQYF